MEAIVGILLMIVSAISVAQSWRIIGLERALADERDARESAQLWEAQAQRLLQDAHRRESELREAYRTLREDIRTEYNITKQKEI